MKRNLCTKRKIVNEYKVYVKKIYDLFVGTVLGLDKSSKHVGFLFEEQSALCKEIVEARRGERFQYF